MNGKLFLTLTLLCAFFSVGWGQEFPIGIIGSGNQSAVDSIAAMGFTWMDASGGWDLSSLNPHKLQNNRNLKVLAHLDRDIYYPSVAQRMEYQA